MSRTTVAAAAPTLPFWLDVIRGVFRSEWLAKLFGPDCGDDTRSSVAPWLADEATLEILDEVVSE